MKIFSETDPMTRDAARMMFGGKEIVYRGYDNVITVPICTSQCVLPLEIVQILVEI